MPKRKGRIAALEKEVAELRHQLKELTEGKVIFPRVPDLLDHVHRGLPWDPPAITPLGDGLYNPAEAPTC